MSTNSEDSSGTATPMTMSGSKDNTPRKIAAQDTAALRTTPVVQWTIQQVAAFFQMHGIEDTVVQKAAAEMIAGADLLELENVSACLVLLCVGVFCCLCACPPRAADFRVLSEAVGKKLLFSAFFSFCSCADRAATMASAACASCEFGALRQRELVPCGFFFDFFFFVVRGGAVGGVARHAAAVASICWSWSEFLSFLAARVVGRFLCRFLLTCLCAGGPA